MRSRGKILINYEIYYLLNINFYSVLFDTLFLFFAVYLRNAVRDSDTSPQKACGKSQNCAENSSGRSLLDRNGP